MDTIRKVPELSLMSFLNGSNTDKTRFVDNLFTGLKDYGFIVLVDHPVDQEVTNKAYNLVHEFFQLPEETKRKYVGKNGGQRGYTAFGVEHAKNVAHAAAPPEGMKVPENGAVPVEIAAVAEGVKVVFVKLSPKLPLLFTN